MSTIEFGAQELNKEDLAYSGSRFAEVREAIFANPYKKIWGREGEPALPWYDTTLRHVLTHVWPFKGPHF